MHVSRLIRRALERLRESAEGPPSAGRHDGRRTDAPGFGLCEDGQGQGEGTPSGEGDAAGMHARLSPPEARL